MSEPRSTLSDKSPEELALMKNWVETWKTTGPLLEKMRREEIRNLDTYQSISNLLGTIDFTQEPFRAEPTSGLIQQQAWFKKFRQ